MNKTVSIKDTSAIFLVTVLVTGIVVLPSLSFITASALTGPLFTEDNSYDSTGYQPEYVDQKSNSYESTKYEINSNEKPSYRNDNYEQSEYSTYTPDYKIQYSSYEQDRNSYKSKDNSVILKKINCDNINVNVNGLGINATGADAADDSSIPVTDAISSQGYGENNGYKKSDNEFKFVCINNNNNTVIVGNGTTTPEPFTCEECFTTVLTEEELDDLIEATEAFTTLEEICNFIDTNFENESQRLFISEYLFDTANDIGISTEKIDSILDCLEEIYGVDFPRP